MAELSMVTKQLQAMLPQWMKMAKDPESVGAQFLNVFGLEFEDVQSYLDQMNNGQHIGTADLSQIDIIYKVPIAMPEILDMSSIHTLVGKKGIGSYAITIYENLADFYSADAASHSAIFDRGDGLVYVRPSSDLINQYKTKPYDYIEIDGIPHYDLILHHIWNAFDEFGLLLGIHRLYGERNSAFQARILDVFKNPGGASKQGIINGLSRELGIAKDQIMINELADEAFKNTMINEDGSPSKKLVDYAERINKLLGFTWGNMSWDEAYWYSVKEANIGFDYLPHVWDVTTDLWKNEDFQSGIGDGDDLLVSAPVEQSNIRNFKYYVGLRGAKKTGKLVYPEHSFKYSIVATGKIFNQESKPQNYKYTIVAGEIVYLYFIIRAFQQYTHVDHYNFKDLTGIKYDNDANPNLEVVDGTTIMSAKSDPFVDVEVYMRTESNVLTPRLHRLELKWKDTSGGFHDLILDSQNDFDRNDAGVKVTKENTITTAEGDVELGYGDFYHVIDTEGDWNGGECFNVSILPEGSIRLIKSKI